MSSREETNAETSASQDVETDYDNEPPETVSERFMALSEIFPKPVVSFSNKIFNLSAGTVKGFYKFTCNAAWSLITSATVIFLPLIFEMQRAKLNEFEKSQRQKVLLGPNGTEYPLRREHI